MKSVKQPDSPKWKNAQPSIMSFFGGNQKVKSANNKVDEAAVSSMQVDPETSSTLPVSPSVPVDPQDVPNKQDNAPDPQKTSMTAEEDEQEDEEPLHAARPKKIRKVIVEESDEENEAVFDTDQKSASQSVSVNPAQNEELSPMGVASDVQDAKTPLEKTSTSSAPVAAKSGKSEGPEAKERRKKGANEGNRLAPSIKLSEKLEEAAGWKAGEPVPYKALAEVLDKIGETSGRLEIQNILRVFFEHVLRLTPGDLAACVFLCCNEVAPAYKGAELGIGDSLLIKAICNATGRQAGAVKTSYEEEGDLGLVAQTSKSSQKTLGFASKPKPLTAVQVLTNFRNIAEISGGKSGDRKVSIIQKMLLSCTGVEPKFLIRGLQGKLRIGLAAQTVLVSLAHAVVNVDPVPAETFQLEKGEESEPLHPFAEQLRTAFSKEDQLDCAVNIVKQAYSECPNYESLVDAMLSVPLYRIHTLCHLQPGTPVAPMLAKPQKSIDEVMSRLNGLLFTCEFKYDGERAQVHLLPDGSFKIFSRNSEDNSQKYPDIMEILDSVRREGVQSFVIDAEVVAFNKEDGCLLPFQVLSTRKRKEENKENIKVQVILEAFDLLYLNGKSYLQETLQKRREALKNSFNEVEGKFRFATSMDHLEDGDTAPIETFLEESVKASCEGLMVKTLIENSTYEPSKRSLNWLKLKKDYLENMGVADSLDVVPIGAYIGRGKRTGFYGAYLLACFDPETEDFQSICKIGTGFTDEMLSKLMETMKEYVIPKPPPNYLFGESVAADVWFSASKVWEIRGADLSKSSTHKCALGKTEPGRGIGLRFPRFLRERYDKNPEQATTCDQILEMYYKQEVVGDQGADNQEEEDGYL